MAPLQPSVDQSPNMIDHMCHISFTEEYAHRCMVGIIGTLGPSCRSVETMYELIKAGMNMVRINFAHETLQDHIFSLKCIEEAQKMYSKEIGRYYPLAVIADLKGRVIRTGQMSSKKVIEIKVGDTLRLSINEGLAHRGTKEAIFVDYPNIIRQVLVGQKIFIDDSAISVEVTEVGVDCLVCRILTDGYLRDYMSVVILAQSLELPVVSEKDAEDIKLCIANKLDFFFVSKVRTAADVRAFREHISTSGRHFKVFTKLENIEALENLDEILEESDGVVFARADLSIELSIGKIFLAQKAVAARCNRIGKPIIIGTQLLMSMNHNKKPIRSDIVDIGNAIIDGADCLLLSSETAISLFPVEAMKILKRTCAEAEAAVWHQKLFHDLVDHNPGTYDSVHAIAISAVRASMAATAIFVLTVSGKSAQLISMYRPRCPIFVITRCSRIARQMRVHRNVIPLLLKDGDKDKRLTNAVLLSNKMGIVQENDTIIAVMPSKQGNGYTNNIIILTAQFTQHKLMND